MVKFNCEMIGYAVNKDRHNMPLTLYLKLMNITGNNDVCYYFSRQEW
jgi:hypothetical protein